MENTFKDTTPKKEKRISEKTLVSNIAACVIGVLLCLTSLTAATWAWFGDNITSTSNGLQTGVYSLGVTVTADDGTELAAQTAQETKSKYYELEQGVTYTVTLKGEGSVTTGYCIVSFSDIKGGTETKRFYSSQIFTENAPAQRTPREITFTLTPDSDAKIYFSPCWGTCSQAADILGGKAYAYSAAEQSWSETAVGLDEN